MSNVQVLITTMHLTDAHQLLEKMNIGNSFLIGNQTSIVADDVISFRGNKGYIFSRKEKGVGKNRNVLLQNATGKYCVLADDDMVFDDKYEQIVEQAFDKYGDADVLIFNLKEPGAVSNRRINKTASRVNILNYMNYGATRIVFRLSSIRYAGIFFNLNFGGGTKHSCGEDTLFLRDCLKKGLKVMTVPVSIATLRDDRPSTWFEGYTQKFFFDKGLVLGLAHPYLARIFALYLAIRHKCDWGCGSIWQTFKEMLNGINYVKNKKYR